VAVPAPLIVAKVVGWRRESLHPVVSNCIALLKDRGRKSGKQYFVPIGH
jgi:hypothetical protein